MAWLVLTSHVVAAAKRYQDLICWQLANELEKLVFELTETGRASKDFRFRDQIRDSSSSATRNMAEGFGRFWPAAHAHFLRIAKASLLETHNSAGTRLSRGYFSAEDIIRHLESQIPQSQRPKRSRRTS